MFEIGKKYRTVGGWCALVIWTITKNNLGADSYTTLVVSHKPNTTDETIVFHDGSGITFSAFAVNAPPLFDSLHPATLTEEEFFETAEPEYIEESTEDTEIINLQRGHNVSN